MRGALFTYWPGSGAGEQKGVIIGGANREVGPRAWNDEPVRWSDEVDEVIRGDLTAAVAYLTPAGGAVVTAVAPVGIDQREAGGVGFTTSLGFAKEARADHL